MLSGKVIGSIVGVAALGLSAVLAARAWQHNPTGYRVSEVAEVEARRPSPRAKSKTTPGAEAARTSAGVGPKNIDQHAAAERFSHTLAEFHEDCWREQNRGKAYARQPIAKLSIVVPSAPEGDTPFDFCVEQVRLDDMPLTWKDDGWVVREDNEPALAGVWFPYGDRHTFWSVPTGGRTFRGLVRENEPICVRGSTARVGREGYSDSWGAGIGLFLNKSGEQIGLYEPGFSRIEIVVSGPHVPNLRLSIDDDVPSTGGGSRWCLNVRT